MPMRLLSAAFLVCVLTSTAAAQQRYRNPVVFQRAELDEQTGKVIRAGKIWIMEEDGSRQRRITDGMTYDEHASMYSDQEQVLFSQFNVNRYDHDAGADLIKQNIYTGEREVVAHEDGCALHHASLSPVGDTPAYHRNCGPHRSQRVGFGGEAYEVLFEATNGVVLGDSIIAMHEKNREVSPRQVSLLRIWGSGAGSRAVALTDDRSLHRRAAVSPDGKQFAWQTDLEGDGDEIYLAEIDASNPRNLTEAKGNDGHPWFSRDGKWIVFESDRSGQWEIWRLELASGKQEQLTDGGKKYASTRARM
jgi:Tol biopolymer transport system component